MRLFQLSQLLFTAVILSSCAQFHTGRSFLTEMENDDSRFFTPNVDFPVTAGDSGRYWNSESEQRARTPASEYDLAQERSRLTLEEELRELEYNQSESAAYVYEKHKNQFSTTSEKIYFLKLPPHQRMDYLDSRGFLKAPESPYLNASREAFGVRAQDVILGMSKGDVLDNMGKPLRVEIAGNPSYENERWIYNYNGAMKYIYFESGRVEGWE